MHGEYRYPLCFRECANDGRTKNVSLVVHYRVTVSLPDRDVNVFEYYLTLLTYSYHQRSTSCLGLRLG